MGYSEDEHAQTLDLLLGRSDASKYQGAMVPSHPQTRKTRRSSLDYATTLLVGESSPQPRRSSLNSATIFKEKQRITGSQDHSQDMDHDWLMEFLDEGYTPSKKSRKSDKLKLDFSCVEHAKDERTSKHDAISLHTIQRAAHHNGRRVVETNHKDNPSVEIAPLRTVLV